MDQIRERLKRDEYAVDPQKVADAILRRLLVGESREDAHRA
jgi:anti-sigma28 factor (negative regulator of flagellin synthesis)